MLAVFRGFVFLVCSFGVLLAPAFPTPPEPEAGAPEYLLPNDDDLSPEAEEIPKAPAPPPSEEESLRKLLDIENQRLSADPFTAAALSHPSERIVRMALQLLGRLGDPEAVPLAAPFLEHSSDKFRRAAAFSLGQMGGPDAARLLQARLEKEGNAEVRKAAYLGLGRLLKQSELPFLAQALGKENPPEVAAAVAQAIGFVWAREKEFDPALADLARALVRLSIGSGASTDPTDGVAARAAFALSRIPGGLPASLVSAVAEASLLTKSEVARATLAKALGTRRSAVSERTLARLLTTGRNLGVRVEAATALGQQAPSAVGLAALRKALADTRQTPPSLVVAAVAALGQMGANAETPAGGTEMRTAGPLLQSLARTHPSPWVKGRSLEALAQVDPTAARVLTTEILGASKPPLFLSAIGATGTLAAVKEGKNAMRDADRLLALSTQENPQAAATAIEALSRIPKERLTSLALAPSLEKALERGDGRLVCAVADVVVASELKELARPLNVSYGNFPGPDGLDARICILTALKAVGGAADLELVETALTDPVRQVAEAAAQVFHKITGENASAAVTRHTRMSSPTPTLEEIDEALQSEVVLATPRGEIHLEMLAVAPLTAVNFVRLARKGYYKGITFHRVVPNFVAQGGDPRGDGWGGPGYLIREEISRLTHAMGTVGMATSGKDTGGSQFFINHTYNFRLDGNYTLFARVTKGMNVALRLEEGDTITSATVRAKGEAKPEKARARRGAKAQGKKQQARGARRKTEMFARKR